MISHFKSISGKYLLSICLFAVTITAKADNFDEVRIRWRNLLIGGDFQINEPYIQTKVENITSTALGYWKNGFNLDSTKNLWDDINYSNSSTITTSYRRLTAMTLAYCTKSSTLYQNDTLKNNIIYGLDWLNEKKYNINVPLPDGSQPSYIENWWDYVIGTPIELNNITTMLYNELGQTRVQSYMAAITHFTPDLVDPNSTTVPAAEFTGANRVWICTIIAVKSIILKDTVKLAYAKDGIGPVFQYVLTSDGFYKDGSFIQHGKTPYSGGYGTSLLGSLSRLMYLLANSPWEITDPARQNVFSWIQNSFEPIVSPSGVMAMVAGREISRVRSPVEMGMRSVEDPLLLLSEIADSLEAGKIKSLLKNWFLTYTSLDYKSYLDIFNYRLAAKIVNDTTIQFQPHFGYKQFPNMDRVVLHRPNYTFGVSMHSQRIYNYESINNENIKGWHTGDGMTYLYNSDVRQFEGSFWPTVNFYRLPGTTVEENTKLSPAKTGGGSWTGGTNINNLYGVTGMYLAPQGQSLIAKKSWFMFDNEIVALGAGVVNGNQKNVQTFIEQRKLDRTNVNDFIVNGSNIPASDSVQAVQTVKWAHLSGTTPNADIGYYFPDSTQLSILRGKQSGRWNDINTTITVDKGVKTNYFLTMWYNHGIHSSDTNGPGNKYAYVLLPGANTADVQAYSGNPDIIILDNTATVQAVQEKNLNMIAANFWKDEISTVNKPGSIAYLTCNKKAAVIVLETPDDITVSLADPTMLNSATIEVTIKVPTGTVISKDAELTVTTTASETKIVASVTGLKGKTVTAKIAKIITGTH